MKVRKRVMIAIHDVFWVVAVVTGLVIFAGSAGVAYAQSVVQKYWADNYGVLPPLSAPDISITDQKYPQNWSDNYGVSLPAPDHEFYQFSRLAKAQPDECFDRNNPYTSWLDWWSNYPNDLTSDQQTSCRSAFNEGKQLKTNQAYLWGFTNWRSDLWFGTIANTLCAVVEGLGTTVFPDTKTVYCNGDISYDLRAPRIFLYDTKNGQLMDMTSQVLDSGSPHSDRLTRTIGLRSAGSMGDVVFLGGLSDLGVTMFAFDGKTRTFIDSQEFSGLGNIRQWLVARNQLYVGVGVGEGGVLGATSGEVWRWTGNVMNPFQFQTVGVLNADPAYLALYEDRLFATTWGGCIQQNGTDPCYGTQLYVSPKICDLSPENKNGWKVVWKYSDYEVEPSAAMAGGAVMAHDGWLYWTTMMPPGVQALTFTELYPKAPSQDGFLGSYRPTSMFRGKFLNSSGRKMKVELLYGNAKLPKYVKTANPRQGCESTDTNCRWQIVPNDMREKPQYGLSGYNNFFNSYTWWMHVYNRELFIGTFDWSYLLFEYLFDLYGNPIPHEVVEAARQFEGADLLRIPDSHDPAYAVSLNGVGNFSNYGVRNMLSVGCELFIGTANPFNLLNPPTNADYDNQLGGWELLHLKPTDTH